MTSLSFGQYADAVAVENSSAQFVGSAVARTGEDAGVGTLTERDQRLLEFERQWWRYAGAKEQAIRDLFEMSSTRYYQVLNGLLDDPAAMAFDPMLIKRLRRMRSARQQARSARRLVH
jgi:hypothetical protein